MKDDTAPKKKKVLLGLIVKGAIGLLSFGIAMGILVTIKTAMEIKGCNEGKSEDCDALLKSEYTVDEDFDPDQITNEEYKPKFVAKVEAAKKAEAEREAYEEMFSAQTQAMSACRRALKAAMKDPDSFRVLNSDYANLLIEYSATNSFGGRIRNVMDCKTGKNLR
ncbi:hypothetical protein [Synechococcus sp. N32]|uniref:hypothetical protein n=1 Tax=Synechococcus sp. N32 TaxID=2575514 RepID=UPI000E0ECC6F|nr:hypothetical protein [Synechococcus sp. N32]